MPVPNPPHHPMPRRGHYRPPASRSARRSFRRTPMDEITGPPKQQTANRNARIQGELAELSALDDDANPYAVGTSRTPQIAIGRAIGQEGRNIVSGLRNTFGGAFSKRQRPGVPDPGGTGG